MKKLTKTVDVIKICPEQLGGLPTPRLPAEYKNGRVIDSSGTDLTREFEQGAEAVLEIAKRNNIKLVILKQRSPSCGCGQLKMLDGTVVKGDGVTANILKKNGIKVKSEEDL